MTSAIDIKWEDIRIISTEEITIYPKPGQTSQIVVVTYIYKDFPPRTVWIDKDKYTKQNLLRLIQEDLKSLTKPPVLPP